MTRDELWKKLTLAQRVKIEQELNIYGNSFVRLGNDGEPEVLSAPNVVLYSDDTFDNEALDDGVEAQFAVLQESIGLRTPSWLKAPILRSLAERIQISKDVGGKNVLVTLDEAENLLALIRRETLRITGGGEGTVKKDGGET